MVLKALLPKDIESLLKIGSALMAERDINTLLSLILRKSRKILGADAGSLFLAQFDATGTPIHLQLKLSQNDSMEKRLEEISLPISKESLAGYVASTGEILMIDDVYDIDANKPYTFLGRIDKKTGYRSRSLLAVPMLDHKNVLIGVIQLWNKKKNPKHRLSIDNMDKEVVSFDQADCFLLQSLASQAAIAVENAKLYQDIETLFEGFIRASVMAIESRDPTTSGHSERVAVLTVALAEAADENEGGIFRNIRFSKDELKEIQYASLLHDFGKIGVRESVLVKAKKLYPLELEMIQDRLDIICQNFEIEALRKKVAHLSKKGQQGDAAWLEIELCLQKQKDHVKHMFDMISHSNEPTLINEEVTKELKKLLHVEGLRPGGKTFQLINQDQLVRLSVPKGTLSTEERREIEEHVSHTYEFLNRIPWTAELRRIPDIAHAHHEKLNGTGYPRKARVDGIPIASQMMAVTDIYDALVARDRPYKRAIPNSRAFEILMTEAAAGMLNKDIVDLFIQKKIYQRTNPA